MICQHLQPKPGRCELTADRGVGDIPVLGDLLCGQGRVIVGNQVPLRMLFQVILALAQRLLMGVYGADLIERSAWQAHEHMLTRDHYISDDIILKVDQQVKIVPHDAGRGILYRKHCIIRRSLGDRFHSIPEAPHVKAVHILAEIFPEGRMRISPFRTLINDPDVLAVHQSIHLDKGQLSGRSALCEQAVTLFTVDRAQMREHFLEPVPGKVILLLLCQLFDPVLLPVSFIEALSQEHLLPHDLFPEGKSFFQERGDFLICLLHHCLETVLICHDSLFL